MLTLDVSFSNAIGPVMLSVFTFCTSEYSTDKLRICLPKIFKLPMKFSYYLKVIP
jgi:hypothetical protein